MRYGFLGMGNMAGAILRGAIRSGAYAPGDILGYDPSPQAKDTADACGITLCASERELVERSDVVVLAVKPQVLPGVMPLIKPYCAGKRMASIAAGKSLAFLEEGLGAIPIVRVMPNINAVVGAATTAICANAYATAEDVALVHALFATVGTVTELPESQFAIFSAIAGASPAFNYIYIDALTRAAVRAGMPRAAALQAAASAVMGSAKMILEGGETPHALADKVCSPGGTTIEGVHVLKREAFEGIVEQAVSAVIEKDKKL